MSDPWFSPVIGVTLVGVVVGGGGGLIGALAGVYAPQGKHRGAVLGLMKAYMVLCALGAVVGVVAELRGQPDSVWQTLLWPPACGLALFAFSLPMVRRRYRDAGPALQGPRVTLK